MLALVLEQLRELVLALLQVLQGPLQLAWLARHNHRNLEPQWRVSRKHHASNGRLHSSRLHRKRSSSCEFLARLPLWQKLLQQ